MHHQQNGTLQSRLANEFDGDEMDALAFGMGYRTGELWMDEATLDERARLLVEAAVRHGSLPLLTRLVIDKRGIK